MDKRASHIFRWSCVAATLGLAPSAVAQVPVESDGQAVVCSRRGRLHRLFHHSAHTLQDKFVGYPENFAEPPLGSYINEQFAVQVAKADTHRFTLYRSDFLPGTSQFSPVGASRYNIMATRMPGWVGPIRIEWTPEQPELAQARRRAIVETLNKAGQPIVADRVVIAPSPYPGAMGIEAMNNFNNTIARTQLAAPTFALPPIETAASGVR
ncbi:MAG TPA: hypothetical protein VHS97_15275 [Isosphaeraceae bacterium]|jgi:hypothetical protein|nr:hypothetical protein [Isosphaeraceae bacterium]